MNLTYTYKRLKMNTDIKTLTEQAYNIAISAGNYAKYLRNKIYKNGFLPFDLTELTTNSESCATNEDILLSNFILEKISEISTIPIISEESHTILQNDTFWCVDPLDGSFCFSHNTGPYSILISLIKNGRPILGIAHYPEQNRTYMGAYGIGSYIIQNKQKKLLQYKTVKYNANTICGLITNAVPDPTPVKFFLEQCGIKKFKEVTGAPNPALVLTGLGDVMPLFHRQYEWDIAAYDAIIKYSTQSYTPGIFDLNGLPVVYGKQNNNRPFENPKLLVVLNDTLKQTIISNKTR